MVHNGTWLWRSSFLSGIPTQALTTEAAGNAYIGVNNGVLLEIGPQAH